MTFLAKEFPNVTETVNLPNCHGQVDANDDDSVDEEVLYNLAVRFADPDDIASIDRRGSTVLDMATVTTDPHRRVSRKSFNWFQANVDLIDPDGKLNDEYIMRRQSANKIHASSLLSVPVLTDLTKSDAIDKVDGSVLTQLIVCGFAKLAAKVDELNKINVFPIADGDTGANMKVCLKVPTRNLLIDPSPSVRVVTSNLAADVLLNGQGNSGTILSHFFVSLAEEVRDMGKDVLSVEEFATCLARTGAKMDSAVPDPIEGTLVSVIRDGCATLSLAGPFQSLADLLEVWSAGANAELSKTPEQLVVDGERVLEKAGVVDSGAQGFVYFVDGMVEAARGQLSPIDPSLFAAAGISGAAGVSEEVPISVDHSVCDTANQFCTEAVVLLKDGIDKSDVLEAIAEAVEQEGLGDSIACVGAPAKEGGDMVKVHIHTNHPDRFFEVLRPFSRSPVLKKEKVEDMHVMRDHAHGKSDLSSELSDAKFTIVGLSAVVLPFNEQSNELHTIPIFLVPSTTQEPIDCRYVTCADVISTQNAQRHKETAVRYTTAASNPMQIKVELLAALSRGKPLLVFVMSKDKRISALGRNIMTAIDMLTPEQQAMVTVHVHGWGLLEGLFIQEAIDQARRGRTVEQAYAACKELADRNSFFVNIVSSTTVRKLMAWRPGLFPKGFTVSDGQFFSFGLAPKIREGEPLSDFQRAGAIMNMLGTKPTLSEVLDNEVKRIKDTLEEGQVLASVSISCVGRPDYGHELVRKLSQAGIAIRGEPNVYLSGFFSVAVSSWGELTFTYKVINEIEDVPVPQ